MVCSGRSIMTRVGANPSRTISSGSKVSPCAEEKVAESPTAAKTSANRERTQKSRWAT